MGYVGTVGEKITVEVTLVNVYEWLNKQFNYYGTTNYIYTMKDADGNIYVWKTTSFMSVEVEKDKWYGLNKNDRIRITGTVKAHSTYKEEAQTVLQRVKYELIERSITWEEKKASKQQEQYKSLQDGDFVWVMPYKQYKEHYSDCETIYHSYDPHSEEEFKRTRRVIPTIAVIIRKGRLKASGVRGEHYSGYQMENELGEKCTYRAITEENALKRINKDFPEHTWQCVKIFNYERW